MSNKIRDLLFVCITSVLIFNQIPKPIQMSFIGGQIGNKLVFYPILIGFIYTAYCQWKYKNVLVNFKGVIKYLSLYLVVMLLSLTLGLFNYPYWNDVLVGPVNQIKQMPMVLNLFESYGVETNVNFLTILGFIAKQLKLVLLEIFWCFGGAYMFYCWYRENWRQGFRIIIKASLISILIIFTYSFIECSYLMHNDDAAIYLQKINPYIHEVEVDGMWWPPLLWKGQLRSVFAEPSYFGIYSACLMPFLWYKLIKDRSILYFILTFIMTFLLFLTKARTGFMLHLGQLFLLALAVLFFLRKTKYVKNTAFVALCSVVAFISSNYFINTYMDINIKNNTVETDSLNKSMNNYIDSNMASLANPDKRSNRARYSIMEADFKIGFDHPLLGVGMGLRNGYIPDYLSEKGKQNGEVKMWLAFREKLGIMRSGFPKLGEYTSRFCETGILGLAIFLFPPMFLLWNMLLNLRDRDGKYKLEYPIFVVSLLGIMASGIGDTLNITYCYWVLLGFGYAMCFGKCGEIDSKCNERA